MNPKLKWNTKYTERLQSKKTLEANPRLKALTQYLSGGRALDLACGLGGNSLYLARMNYHVQAFDISDVAIESLNKQIAKENLNIETNLVDLTTLTDKSWPQESFDLVVVTYYLDRALIPIVKNILKKDGYFFMETYYQSPKKKNEQISDRFKLHPQELLSQFADWHIHFFEENEQEGRQTIFCEKQSDA